MLQFELPTATTAEIAKAKSDGINALNRQRITRLERAARNIVHEPKRTTAALAWLGNKPTSAVHQMWRSLLEERSSNEIAAFLTGEKAEFGSPGKPLCGDLDEQLRLSLPPHFLSEEI